MSVIHLFIDSMLENIPSPCDQIVIKGKSLCFMVICVRNCVGFMVYFSDAWRNGSYIPSSHCGVLKRGIIMCATLCIENCILSLE